MLNSVSTDSEAQLKLPRKPERPLDSDCCGQGCVPCVFDLYEEEVKIWEDECRKVAKRESKEFGQADCCIQAERPVLFLSTHEYRKFTIESISKETSDTRRYIFRLPYDVALGLRLGQHIVLRGVMNDETVSRQYTPVSDLEETSSFTLLIKIYDNGKFSAHVKTWCVGSEVNIRGPFGSLDYKQNKYKKIYMLAVGTGIAPMSQVINTVLKNEDEDTMIQLLYGCRTYNDILMKKEQKEWSRYWNFTCHYFLSQEDSTSSNAYGYGEKIFFQQVNLHTLQETINDITDNIFIFICGTRSFEKDMLRNMELLGIPSHKYHKF